VNTIQKTSFRGTGLLYSSLVFVSLLFITSCRKENKAPVLILAEEYEFGSYTGEILHAEGFNEFVIKSAEDEVVTESFLNDFDILILAQRNLSDNSCDMIRKYLRDGGNLIAFRPDSSLYDIFGISGSGGLVKEGYIRLEKPVSEETGFISGQFQYHGKSESYITRNSRVIASLCSSDGSPSVYPAIAGNRFGKGNAVVFSYNLPETVVLTRQGNPESAAAEKDGIPGLRPMDLFTGGWIDTSLNALNQADLHLNLLSYCIEEMTGEIRPLPRLWYFPDNLKCMISLTNDGEYKGQEDFERQFRDVDSCGAAMSLYVLETGKINDKWVADWTGRGFEISGHPDYSRSATDPDWTGMDSAVQAKKHEISRLYGLPLKTNVNHWFVWCGSDSTGRQEFAAQAMIEEKHGIRMDVNYAHYDNGSSGGRFLGTPGYAQGNFTGSGLVMKFAGSKGGTLDIYQHLNNVYDQQYLEQKDPEGFFQCFKGLTDRSIYHEKYSFISIKSHNDEYYFTRLPILRMLAYADSLGIPVCTAAEILDFVSARDATSFENIRWKNDILSFCVKSELPYKRSLTVMVPASVRSSHITEIELNGSRIDFEARLVRGKEYSFFMLMPGKNHDIKVYYN